jgi:DNA repair protein RecN (Recombination protein N)
MDSGFHRNDEVRSMLVELKVRDFGIIEDMSWSLGPGLNVITGETGAGKSLVVDAIEALLMGKLDESAIRHGADEAKIEGVFSLDREGDYSRLAGILKGNGIEADDTLAVSCGLKRQGRGVIRINGQAVTRGLLRQVGDLLIDIHGQSEHLSLLNTECHIDVLDAYAHTLDLRSSFSDKAAGLRQVEQQLKSLDEEMKSQVQREEFLRFQIDEIKQSKLKEGEEEALAQERRVLSSTEKLKEFSDEAYVVISGGDSESGGSALERLSEAVRALKKSVEVDSTLKPQLDVLQDMSYRLEDAARDIRSYGDALEHDPKRLDEVELRLDLISRLKKKYGQNVNEVLAYLKKAEEELETITHSSEKQAELESRRSSVRDEMGKLALKLSQARSKAAKKLVARVKAELKDLNMSQVVFDIAITQEKDGDGITGNGGECYKFNDKGIDYVELMTSTNPGEPVQPLARIASTGEMSRFTLALKGAISEADDIPIMIFDEIDIGVGGRSGEVIGQKLWRLARNRQVICITHLPQIAAYADAHHVVHKEVNKGRTVSVIESVEGDIRLKEIAVMLAGPQVGDSSIKSAKELIKRAGEQKKVS